MKWQSFENKVKTTLTGHKSEVDVDEIWAAIEPAVDAINRRKKRRGIVWFLLAGLLVAGGVSGYFYQNENGGGKEQLSVLPVAGFEKNDNKEEVPTANETATGNHEKGMNPATSNDQLSTSPNTEVLNKNRQPESLPPVFENTAKAAAPPVILDKKDEPAISVRGSETPPTENDERQPEPGLISILPLDFLEIHAKVNLPVSADFKAVEKPPVRRNPYSFSAGLQVSYSFVDRKLTNNDSLSNGLLTLREKTERELESMQAGLRLTLRHDSGFGLTSGANFTQINERFRFNTTITTVDSVYGVKYLVINLDNDTIPIYGEVPVERKTTHRKEYFNSYRMIDVPVLVSYRHQGRGYSVAAEAGVFVNMSLSTEGKFLQTDSEVTDIGNAGIFKSNIGLSYYVGLSAGYLLNENLELYIAPFMRYFPNVAEESYSLKQRYNLYGLNVGAVWHFR